jgi:hypothetical protein
VREQDERKGNQQRHADTHAPEDTVLALSDAGHVRPQREGVAWFRDRGAVCRDG